MVRSSVIIPTFNRPDQLAACIDSFLNLDYSSKEWELILVNDGGDNSFSGITDAMHTRLPLILHEIEHGGPARARNAGAAIARGEFLVFTDDDCLVDPNWLRAYERCFAEFPNCAALGGKTLNPYPDSIPAETWSRYIGYLRDDLMRDQDGQLLLLMSNNSAYRRDVFLNIGGFDEEFPFAAAEDTELGNRLVGMGYQQTYCPAAVIWHDHKNTSWGYLSQQFRYGRGNYYLQKKTKKADYTTIERHKYTFPETMKKILSLTGSAPTPFQMKLLLGATPFAFKAGNICEFLRVQLTQITRKSLTAQEQ